jgi:hypothetical protein
MSGNFVYELGRMALSFEPNGKAAPNNHNFYVEEDYSIILQDTHGKAFVISIPKGFQTDLASVSPAFPLAYTMVKLSCLFSAVVHDYLYTTCLVSRYEADCIFRNLAEAEGVKVIIANAAYLAIRAGGESHYGTK